MALQCPGSVDVTVSIEYINIEYILYDCVLEYSHN